MTRAPMTVLCGSLATLAASCGQREAPGAAPPEVSVAELVQEDVPLRRLAGT